MSKLFMLLSLLIVPTIVVAEEAVEKDAPAAEGKVVTSLSLENAVKALAEKQGVKVDVENNHYSIIEYTDPKTKAPTLSIVEIPALIPDEKVSEILSISEKGAKPATKARHSFVPHRHQKLESIPASWGYRRAQAHCARHAWEDGYDDSELVAIRGPFGAVIFSYDCYGVSRGHHHHHDHDFGPRPRR